MEVLSELKRRYANYLLKLAQLESKNRILKASKELNVTFKRPNKPDSILAVIAGNWTPPLELKVVIIESAGGYVENGTTIKTNSPILTLTKLNVSINFKQIGNHYDLTIHVLDSTGKTFITTAAFEYAPPESCRLVKTEFSDTESSVTIDNNDNQLTQPTGFVLSVLVEKDKIVECKWNTGDNYSEVAEEFLERNKLKPILKIGLVRLMEQQTHYATHTQQVDLADLIIV